jgi:hypothetical protein
MALKRFLAITEPSRKRGDSAASAEERATCGSWSMPDVGEGGWTQEIVSLLTGVLL